MYRLGDMSAPKGGGMSAINKKTGKPNGWYVWKDYQPPVSGWRYSPETMERLDSEGRIYYPVHEDGTPDTTKRLALKRYLAEQEGSPDRSHCDLRAGAQGARNHIWIGARHGQG